MNTRKFHQIWMDQCDATDEIKLRYGVEAAFDYLVAEKLLNFADAAASNPEFARELPRFVACVRGLFTPQELRAQLERIEREQNEYHADNEQDDELETQRMKRPGRCTISDTTPGPHASPTHAFGTTKPQATLPPPCMRTPRPCVRSSARSQERLTTSRQRWWTTPLGRR